MMSGRLTVYECTLCHAYFKDRKKATWHLEKKHPVPERKIIKKKNDELAVDVGVEDVIKPREFPEAFVRLFEVSSELYNKQKQTLTDSNSTTSKNITRKSRAKKVRLEIRLDTLKAGEIETLVTDLLTNASEPAVSTTDTESGQAVVRRSRRKVTERLKSNYVELNSDDDEITTTGSVVGRSRSSLKRSKSRKDDDYVPNSNDKNDMSNFDEDDNDSNSDVDDDIPNGKSESANGTPRIGKTGTYWCHVCYATFRHQLNKYLSHMQTNHMKDGQYICPETDCQRDFPDLQKFTRHRLHAHIKERSPCKVCGKMILVSKSEYNMELHMKSHEKQAAADPKKPHQCPVCQHRFARKCGLKRHFVLHLENAPFACDFPSCGRKFNSEYNLRRHAALHSNRVFYKCNSCPAKFAVEERLKNHEKVFHSPNSKKKYQMRNSNIRVKSINDPVIPTNASEASSIRSHSPNPSEEHDKEEDDNKRSDVPESSMKLHKMFHSDATVKKMESKNPDILMREIGGVFYNKNSKASDFKCQICSWSGSRAFMFQKHMQNRHGATPAALSLPVEPTPDNPLAIRFLCGSCGYQSKSSDDLAAHMSKVHVGARKYHCSYCGIRFTKLAPRDAHVKRVHLTERKFKCDKCSSAYHTRKRLKVHQLEKHDPEFQKKLKIDCKCTICGRILCNKKALTIHVKRHVQPRLAVVSCQICGQTTANGDALKRHIQYVHLGVENPYKKKPQGTKSKGKPSPPDSVSIGEAGVSDTPEASAGSDSEVNETDKIEGSSTVSELANVKDEDPDSTTEILGF